MWYIYKENNKYKYSTTEPNNYLFKVNKISPIPSRPGFVSELKVDENTNTLEWVLKEEITLDNLRQRKLDELEQWMFNQKEIGFVYLEKHFKLDDQATDRINKLATSVNMGVNIFPLQWITRNGEEGLINIENNEQFLEFFSLALIKGSEIETQCAMKKFAIEQAVSEEELEEIAN